MHRVKLIIPLAAVMLAMLAVARIAPSNAAAQYPTPRGALLCTSGVITAQANSSFQFTATLVDINGAPVPGNTVTFIVSGNATLSTTSATTDGNGQAFTTVNTNAGGGQIVVSAAIDQFVCRAVVNVPVEVPDMQCNISQLYQFNSQYSFTVNLRGTTTVLIGQTINFYISSTGGGASLSQIAAITDGNGSASVIVYVLPTSGSVTVTAQYNGLTCPATINVVPPQPACQSPNAPAYCFPPQPTCQSPNAPAYCFPPAPTCQSPNAPAYCFPPAPTCQNSPNPPSYCFVQQVVPPVQYIVPPATGDAGLAVTRGSRFGLAEGLAAIGILGVFSGAAVLSRQVREVHDATTK